MTEPSGSSPAYKLVLLLRRHPDLGPEAFVDAWMTLERERPVAPPGLVRRVFDRPLLGGSPIANAPPAPFDAAEESWWARTSDADDWFLSKEYRNVWLPPRLDLLAEPPVAVGGVPQVLWEREGDDPATKVKVLVLPVARRDLTVEEFRAHWTGRHAELALGGPKTKDRLVRLEDTPSDAAPAIFGSSGYDGVGSIVFESIEALKAEFSSEYYRENLAVDEPRFTTPEDSGALLTTEVPL